MTLHIRRYDNSTYRKNIHTSILRTQKYSKYLMWFEYRFRDISLEIQRTGLVWIFWRQFWSFCGLLRLVWHASRRSSGISILVLWSTCRFASFCFFSILLVLFEDIPLAEVKNMYTMNHRWWLSDIFKLGYFTSSETCWPAFLFISIMFNTLPVFMTIFLLGYIFL